MSKITFRADEDLIERIEARDASKSEIMREALREYLDDSPSGGGRGATDRDYGAGATPGRDAGASRASADSLDALLVERVDELVAERLAAWEARTSERDRARAQDVNVNLTLESDVPVRPTEADARREPASDASRQPSDDQTSRAASDAPETAETTCGQCGESLSDDHVYCPNCGEKASRRVFCECGDEVRSDWGFCPSCGRRTPAADVLDRS